MWSTGEGNGKPLQYCLENPMNNMKRQKDRRLKDEFPRSVGAQCATGEEWRNSYRKSEETEPKQKPKKQKKPPRCLSKKQHCHAPN